MIGVCQSSRLGRVSASLKGLGLEPVRIWALRFAHCELRVKQATRELLRECVCLWVCWVFGVRATQIGLLARSHRTSKALLVLAESGYKWGYVAQHAWLYGKIAAMQAAIVSVSLLCGHAVKAVYLLYNEANQWDRNSDSVVA